MAMKVKIFQDAHQTELEAAVNQWLEENSSIRVDHVTQSQGVKSAPSPTPVCVCVWYTELYE